MNSKNAKSKHEKLDFDTTLEKLESIVDKMTGEDISLGEALETFESGIKLTRDAQKALSEAEQKVQLLMDKNGDATTRNLTTAEDKE